MRWVVVTAQGQPRRFGARRARVLLHFYAVGACIRNAIASQALFWLKRCYHDGRSALFCACAQRQA
jgi:hypothetical protein